MGDQIVIEDGVITGNVYPKYSTRHPIERMLFDGFLQTLDGLVAGIDPPQIHEVGCGEGFLIARFAGQGRLLQATDFSEQVIRRARERSAHPDISFRVASIYDLTKSKHAARLVLCCEVLEHLRHPFEAVDALARIADPYLIASVPREPIWRILNLARGKYVRALGNTPGHVQHWNKGQFTQLLERRFDVLQVRSPLPWTMALCRTRG